jgi:hypothetical protein
VGWLDENGVAVTAGQGDWVQGELVCSRTDFRVKEAFQVQVHKLVTAKRKTSETPDAVDTSQFDFTSPMHTP